MRSLACLLVILLGLLQFHPSVSSEVTDLAKANTRFAVSLYEEIVELAEDGNIFFSPLSISMALGMTYAGARGNTKTQMAGVLEFDEAADSDASLNQAFQELIDALNTTDKNYTLKIANRLFGRQGYNFLPEYLDLTSEYFRAPLEELDFAGNAEGSRTYMNDWVEKQTNRKIKDLLPSGSITAMTALVLINAVYFKGLWTIPFDAEDTESEVFHSIDGRSIKMDMMNIENHFNYAEVSALDSQILELPYDGDEISMCIILPKDRLGIEQLEEKLEDANLHNLFDNLEDTKVEVTLPKFKLTQDISLKSILGSMGMEDLFIGGLADLSGMNGARDLYVTEVLHKAYVDVNEEGTEAAASTAVIVGLTAVMNKPKFVADHPFIFVIRDKTTGSILFMGRLTMPPDQTAALGAFGKGFSVDAAITSTTSWITLILASVCYGFLKGIL